MASGARQRPGRNRVLAGLAATVCAAVLAFVPALHAPLIFDDVSAIARNPTLLASSPVRALQPPPNSPVAGRPAANVSLWVSAAIDRATGVPGSTVGFHLINLLLHVTSGLLLFGVLRRTLVLAGRSTTADGNSWLALLVTAVWLVHPIQAEAVDYLTQRTELMVSWCYLAVMYGAIRGWVARGSARVSWYLFAWLACAVGMASKEVMVTAPVMVLLYDRAFLVPTWRAMFNREHRHRVMLYAAMAATWLLLWVLVRSAGRTGVTSISAGYAVGQGWAIARYLRLLVVPAGFSIDYGLHSVDLARALPGLLVVAALVIIVMVTWFRGTPRRRQLAFAGVWFLLLLAPSSSVVAVPDEIAAERRVYLASAGCFALLILALATLIKRMHPRRAVSAIVLPGIAVAVVLLLAVLSGRRSEQFADPETLWRDAVRVVPANPRAWNNLAAAVSRDPARQGEAVNLYRRAVAIDSTYLPAQFNLALSAVRSGDTIAARHGLEYVVRRDPRDLAARLELARLALAEHDPGEARVQLVADSAGVRTAEFWVTLGLADAMQGRASDAAEAWSRALALDPTRQELALRAGMEWLDADRPDSAVALLELAARSGGNDAAVLAALARAYAGVHRAGDAMRAATQAVDLAPTDPQVYFDAGRAMIDIDRDSLADGYLVHAASLAPGNASVQVALAIVRARLGDVTRARAILRRVLQVDPQNQSARAALAALGG